LRWASARSEPGPEAVASDRLDSDLGSSGAKVDNGTRRDAWALYARSYDRVLPRLPFYQEALRRHTTAMCRGGIRDVIDIGAGTGNVSLPLLQRGLRVTAVDQSPDMLARLRAKLTPGDNELKLLERDASDLSELEDASFDGATILLVFYDMSHPREALDEVVRVLRPGGSFVATETKDEFQLQPLLDFVDGFLKAEGLMQELREDWERVSQANRVLDPGARESRLTIEEIRQRLLRFAFRIDKLQDSHLGQCATVWATKAA
jgi:ubiquinone/menaquinone biosynthesis C-methylase UbiE